MEKNRRAQLKECFDQLKKQLPHNESEKKTSNLSILGNAYKSISVSRKNFVNFQYYFIELTLLQMMLRKEKELEQEMEKLAKEKVAQHSRIQELKRDLTAMSEQGIVFPSGDADSVVRERCKYTITPRTTSHRVKVLYSSDHLFEGHFEPPVCAHLKTSSNLFRAQDRLSSYVLPNTIDIGTKKYTLTNSNPIHIKE